MHADEIIARWPETALVADVLPVRYRNIPSTAIDFADWKALVLLCERLVADTADLAGIVIGHGTATLEETAYVLNLTLKVACRWCWSARSGRRAGCRPMPASTWSTRSASRPARRRVAWACWWC